MPSARVPRRRVGLLFLVPGLLLPGSAVGQQRDAPAFASPAPDSGSLLTSPAGAFAASLVVPGAGQAALGLRRWIAYGAIEAGLWVLYLDARHDASRLTGAYRDLAWEVARDPMLEPRHDGGWGYYEAMSHYARSGGFDVDPALAGIQPETDSATYNGAVWELARELYLPGGDTDPSAPGYGDALRYYQDRAAGPEFLWSWDGKEMELQEFRRLINAADDESRNKTTALGLILANHLVAAVDALIVARLRGDSGAELRSDLIRESPGPRMRVSIHIPFDL